MLFLRMVFISSFYEGLTVDLRLEDRVENRFEDKMEILEGELKCLKRLKRFYSPVLR